MSKHPIPAQRPPWLLPGIIGGLVLAAVALIVARLPIARVPPASGFSALGVKELGASQGRFLVFRSREEGTSDKHLAVEPLDRQGALRSLFAPRCERVAASHRYLVCMGRALDPLRPYQVTLFDSELHPLGEVPLAGSPSRTRLSPDEKYFATTTFVVGDSYSDSFFSTRSFIHKIAADGKSIESSDDVELYGLMVNDQLFTFPGKDVWGITFVPGQDRFFATVSLSGHRYLVDGSITAKRMVALRDNVECPSLSPDGKKLAYKMRVDDGQTIAWKFHLLDLLTGQTKPLGENRSIDDQIAWLDNTTVLYGVERDDSGKHADIWKAPIDGGPPSLFLKDADSPTIMDPSE